MPFLKAGFNAANHKTGIKAVTRSVHGGRAALAELRQFECGDYFWLGAQHLAWGESCRFLNCWGVHLPYSVTINLPQSRLA